MIKFFRQIRKSLLMENPPTGKVGRYFKYAIGEIVLVVIGILIALQINNWNEDNKNKTTEKVFINNLTIDLKRDIEVLKWLITYNKLKLSRIDSLLEYSNKNINDMPDHNQLYYLVNRSLLNNATFSNQNRTLNKLSILDNDIIRQHVADSIATFLQNLTRLEGQSESYMKSIFDTRPVMNKLFKLYLVRNPEYYDQTNRKFTGRLFPKINADKELQSEFFNYVSTAYSLTFNYLSDRYLLGHLHKTESLLHFLETEYKLTQ